MTAVDAWPGLRRAAACGPFFDLIRWAGEQPAGEPDWYPMTDFADHPLGLGNSVASVRESLLARGFGGAGASPAVAVRVAASVAFLGLAARLLSPVIGSVVAAAVVPDLSWHRLYWRSAAGGVLPLASGPAVGRALHPGGDGSADSEARVALGAAFAPVLRLGDQVAARFSVPRRVVAGNVASAVVGAVTVANLSHPPAAGALRLVAGLLADRGLAGTGTFGGPTAVDPLGRFRRRSCCLLYRVDGAAVCGDCVLHERRRSATGAQRGSAPAQQQDTGRYRQQQDRDR